MLVKGTYIRFGKEAMEEDTWVNAGLEMEEGVEWEGSEDKKEDEQGKRVGVGTTSINKDWLGVD